MAIDVGALLFKDILKMYSYPAAPFSGTILNDLVMFFLIPTIFIILVIYMAMGRLVAGHPGLRLLVGLGAYLFIIFGGYYGVFAALAGPYFIFLIFIMGLLYFFIEHFSKRPGSSSGGGFSSENRGNAGSSGNYQGLENLTKQDLNILLKEAGDVMRDPNTKDKGVALRHYMDIYLEAKRRGIQVSRDLQRAFEKLEVAK